MEGQNSEVGSWIRGGLIGVGAFGRVNLALNREDGGIFAVKSIEWSEMDAGAKNSLKALENEIQVLQSLDSPFIVRCLGGDWSEENGKRMRNMFLEYMPGGSLSDVVKQFAGTQGLDEHLIRAYTRNILEGVDYLHSRGIVHCDLKGKNVLVGNGIVKLTDFGSAKRLGQGEVEGSALLRRVDGTPLWMAPEVVTQVEQGTPSDIWSLGCTVVEMATGRAPWSDIANPLVALYHIGCTDEIPAVPASLSPEAHDFLAKCFERDPRKRWTSSALLQHPFLTDRFSFASISKPASRTPPSPTSTLQFGSGANECSSDMSSSFEHSVPLLSSPFWKLGREPDCANAWASPAKSSPESEGGVASSSGNWWGSPPLSPPAGQWIVVRSPKGSSPIPCVSPFSDLTAPRNESIVGAVEVPPCGLSTNECDGKVTDAEPCLSSSVKQESMLPPACSMSLHVTAHTEGKRAGTAELNSSHRKPNSLPSLERIGLVTSCEAVDVAMRPVETCTPCSNVLHREATDVREDGMASLNFSASDVSADEEFSTTNVLSPQLGSENLDRKEWILGETRSAGCSGRSKHELLLCQCLKCIGNLKCVKSIRDYLHWLFKTLSRPMANLNKQRPWGLHLEGPRIVKVENGTNGNVATWDCICKKHGIPKVYHLVNRMPGQCMHADNLLNSVHGNIPADLITRRQASALGYSTYWSWIHETRVSSSVPFSAVLTFSTIYDGDSWQWEPMDSGGMCGSLSGAQFCLDAAQELVSSRKQEQIDRRRVGRFSKRSPSRFY